MAEYIKRDAAIAAIKGNCWDAHTPVEAVKSVPAVDAVPVVRRKDCKFYQNHGLRDVVFDKDACHWNADEQPDPDDFCSCGERRG